MIRAERLLDPGVLGRYDGLALAVRRGLGERPGERRFPGRAQASGGEVESWAAYAPGDDLRHLDWNAVGRLDALLVRRFVAEREVLFHLLVDASASMGVPARDGKFAAACELTMALAFVALASNDAVRLAVLAGEGSARPSRVYRQRASAREVAAALAAATPGGALALGAALEAYARRQPRPGAALVVSDLMMEPAEVERGLGALRARGWDVALLQVIGPGERDPARELLQGVLRDVESGARQAVRLTPAVRARYRDAFDAHLAALAAVAARTGVPYARLEAGASVVAFVVSELGRLGMVRRR